MKKKLEKMLREAFQAGMEQGAHLQAGNYFDAPLNEDEYIESLKNVSKEEEDTIPITYGLIKATCGWSSFCDITGNNHYAINGWGDYPSNEVFYVKEGHAKELNFI